MTGVAPSVPTTHIDPTAGGPREVELKYAVSDLVALRAGLDGDRIGSLRAGDWRLVEVEDRYLDTAAGALKTAGYGVRLRHVPGGASVLTVKSSSAGDGGVIGALHDRLELEAPAGPRLDPTTWPESEARAIVERITDGERLRTLFVVHQRREERPLSADGSDAVAATLTLDAAEVRLRGRVIGSFDSLEVESADGSTDALNEVARALEPTGLIEAERRNKEEIARGYVAAHADEAARDAALRAAIPKTPGIGADDPLAEAGRKVLRLHFLRMLASEPGTRRGDVVEPLHKMRVATRRMRAVWRVFDGAYRPKVEKRSVARLRTVATALGVVRDLDVQLDALAAHRDSLTEAAASALEPVAADWHRRRDDARTDLVALLDSKAYARFVEDYAAFVETPGAGVAADPDAPLTRVRDSAAGRVWQAFERLRAHDAGLRWADVPALHAIRIDAKRLRYTLESFREVLPADVDSLIATVVAVQDHLGALNDADLGAQLTRRWLIISGASADPDTRDAAAAYLTTLEHEVARLRRTFPAVWRRVTGPAFRRRLAVNLSSL